MESTEASLCARQGSFLGPVVCAAVSLLEWDCLVSQEVRSRPVDGCVQPLGHWYIDHRSWLQTWLVRRLGDAFQAEDLTQDTFVKLSSRNQHEIEQVQQPRAFLRTVAHGLLVSHWRRQDVERACMETLAHVMQGQAHSAEQHAQVREALLALDRLLSSLPPKARQAFLLSQVDGLSYAEIAREMGVSDRMVRKYMTQAMLQCLQSDLWTESRAVLQPVV
ncbi:sigma-70 family RNA polymerase sigma factor [Lampropedia puyangensis]|uniref:Sigma-70 family RNA polymerase sigma factor n=1 Tax=Lampropedia puyangensis TaxID=1330072 RepID=A0A4S8EUV5_9BURK|nr:sigma-70 family RNA polymerase sigma factor [Lampropedia puyangensis]THT97454.1 sigma-70 family RNA polymerase sigma factor [Lampropedia puyangensis]